MGRTLLPLEEGGWDCDCREVSWMGVDHSVVLVAELLGLVHPDSLARWLEWYSLGIVLFVFLLIPFR